MKDPIQEQLIAARRTQILEAATRVFADKGFHPTTIKDIAKEAGIADGTIYNYFKNKNALLIGILELMRQAAQQDADRAALSIGDFRSFIRAYLQQPLKALKGDNFEIFRVVVSEIMVNKELRELYNEKILEPTLIMGESLFELWADQHNVPPQHIHLAIRAVSGMVMGLMMQHFIGDNILESQWEELPDFLTDMLLNGLGPNLS